MEGDLAHPIGVVSHMNGSKRVFKCQRLRCCVTFTQAYLTLIYIKSNWIKVELYVKKLLGVEPPTLNPANRTLNVSDAYGLVCGRL